MNPSKPVPRLAFSHLGFFVRDVAKMEDFYRRVLGFTVTDRGELDTPNGRVYLVFLSCDPRDHHQIVLVTGRPEDARFTTINQISFRMQSVADVREMYRRIQGEPVSEIYPISHGNAISLYFKDPEGNRIELFVDTPWYCRQPQRIPLDLELPDDELLARVEAEARKQPDFQPVEEWRADIARRMNA